MVRKGSSGGCWTEKSPQTGLLWEAWRAFVAREAMAPPNKSQKARRVLIGLQP